ncbi:MAG: hypothetical protein A2284_11335 [Deltaproteobacteria bacterium RIFOXYA12_FULL_61_11]|nr:MAG: hypothetical protein A2284_11335 [Deltaproteobacteria bacterium RIFOXYA12_FULL_61_11]
MDERELEALLRQSREEVQATWNGGAKLWARLEEARRVPAPRYRFALGFGLAAAVLVLAFVAVLRSEGERGVRVAEPPSNAVAEVALRVQDETVLEMLLVLGAATGLDEFPLEEEADALDAVDPLERFLGFYEAL